MLLLIVLLNSWDSICIQINWIVFRKHQFCFRCFFILFWRLHCCFLLLFCWTQGDERCQNNNYRKNNRLLIVVSRTIDMKLVNGSDFNESRFQLRIWYFLKEIETCVCRWFNFMHTIKKQWEYYFIYTKNNNIRVSFSITMFLWCRFEFQIEMVNWHNKREEHYAFPPKMNRVDLSTHMMCLCESSEAWKCNILAEISRWCCILY